MANVEVKIQQIFITPHSNADSLEIGNIGSPDGWQVVVKKDQYKTGDLVAYVGENAVVPEWVLRKYGFWNEAQNKGMLAGSKGNRVKAVRLRQEFSLGICIPTEQFTCITSNIYAVSPPYLEGQMVLEGTDVTELLGIIKHEQPIPAALYGEVYNGGQHIGVNYDVENIKNHPNVFIEGEIVQVTEKLHGTNCQICILPVNNQYHHEEHLLLENDAGEQRYIAVSSKGQGGKGLFLKHNEQNERNVYLTTAKKYYSTILKHMGKLIQEPVTIVGEIFGAGVQDLTYGMSNTEKAFRIFDVYVGARGIGRWLEDDELDNFCAICGIDRVPILYRGPYSKAKMLELSQHTKSVFDNKQVREGIVIKTVPERTYHKGQCRASLKMINEDYYTRKGNTTEFN
jgi:RNA ligase (TIGR02306 family)